MLLSSSSEAVDVASMFIFRFDIVRITAALVNSLNLDNCNDEMGLIDNAAEYMNCAQNSDAVSAEEYG